MYRLWQHCAGILLWQREGKKAASRSPVPYVLYPNAPVLCPRAILLSMDVEAISHRVYRRSRATCSATVSKLSDVRGSLKKRHRSLPFTGRLGSPRSLCHKVTR